MEKEEEEEALAKRRGEISDCGRNSAHGVREESGLSEVAPQLSDCPVLLVDVELQLINC